jgi:hypothetical protein
MSWIWAMAWPSATPGASLNEIVIPGSITFARAADEEFGAVVAKTVASFRLQAVEVNRLRNLDLQVRIDILKNWKSAHLRLDHRLKAVKLIGIAGVKRVQVDVEVLGLQKETAEIISAGEENQQHRGQQEALHWTFPPMVPVLSENSIRLRIRIVGQNHRMIAVDACSPAARW